ncbi:MAG: glycoside hydrolase family 11 protein [Fibrobacter sp.]|nr:glycoside hydrolase family 11 protein [Fibrobacter sp.]
MKKCRSLGTVAVLSLGLFSSQALAQDFCTSGTHSGTSAKTNGTQRNDEYQTISKIGNFDYELWYRGGNGASSATFYSDGSMECSAVNSDDYLCRSGMSFNSDKYYTELGHMYADFKVSLSGQQNIGYSFIGIYGWSEDPMIEYYIVDTWASQYKPGGTGWGWTKKGEYTVDGAKYEAWTHTQVDQWALHGKATFEQFYGVRETSRSCGTIDITAHFAEWEKLGMKLGKMYEAKVLGEVGNGSGVASCEFDFPVARVYTGSAPTPTSSGSSNPGSSASTRTSTGALPGTMEFENYESKQSDSLKVYGDVIGNIQPSDWVEWTVDVSYTGTYNFEILAARGDDQGRESTISLSIDGVSVGSASVLTDGWDNYNTFSGVTSSISAGQHTFRVTFTDGYVNVDNIKFAENEVDKGSKYEPPPEAMAKTRFALKGKDLQVFDMQGRHLGRVSVAAGTTLQDALSAKFHKPGIYLVKQGALFVQVRVNR